MTSPQAPTMPSPTSSPLSDEQREGIELTDATAFALMQMSGGAAWIGYHEQKLRGADAKMCKAARSDSTMLADAAAKMQTLVNENSALLADRSRLSARVEELERDAKRLDALEREAHIEPLALHDGRQDSIGGLRGLGLMPGSLRRTLREAIDTAFLRSR